MDSGRMGCAPGSVRVSMMNTATALAPVHLAIAKACSEARRAMSLPSLAIRTFLYMATSRAGIARHDQCKPGGAPAAQVVRARAAPAVHARAPLGHNHRSDAC